LLDQAEQIEHVPSRTTSPRRSVERGCIVLPWICNPDAGTGRPDDQLMMTVVTLSFIARPDNRTSFAPETTSSKRNERHRTQTKRQQNSTNLTGRRRNKTVAPDTGVIPQFFDDVTRSDLTP